MSQGERTYNEEVKKEMRERNILGPVRVGAVEIAGGVVGMIETDIVGTAETGAEGMAETGATGATGEVVVGISVSVATPGSSKVSAIKGMDIQNKGRPQQRVTQTHMYKNEITKKKKKGGRRKLNNIKRHIPMNSA